MITGSGQGGIVMKKIITISRQFGAAGSTIGKAVADRLGFEFYDRELILQMARNSNLDVATLLTWGRSSTPCRSL